MDREPDTSPPSIPGGDDRAVLARVSGRVQGVGFRAWTRRTALGLGLGGWVRNRPDGSVEALIVGPRAAVAAMLSALREGPARAEVRDLAVEPIASVDAPRDVFTVR